MLFLPFASGCTQHAVRFHAERHAINMCRVCNQTNGVRGGCPRWTANRIVRSTVMEETDGTAVANAENRCETRIVPHDISVQAIVRFHRLGKSSVL